MSGIIVKKTGDTINLEQYLTDTNGAIIETGTTTVWLFWLDGTTMKYYDWGTDTFVTTGGTSSAAMAYKDVNSLGTGIWLKQIMVLTAFTSGESYKVKVNSNDGNWGGDVMYEFGYGGGDGDLTATNIGYIDAAISATSTFDSTSDEVDIGKVKGVGVTDVGDFKADVSGLSTFDSASDEVDIGAIKGVGVTDIDDFKADVSGLSTFDYTSNEVDIGAVKGVGVTDIDDFKADVSGLSAATIAAAVWDKLVADHQISGSFGEFMKIVCGMVGKNMSSHPIYTNGRLTGNTIRIFDTKAQTDANIADDTVETGMLAKFTTIQSFDGNDVEAYSRTDYS